MYFREYVCRFSRKLHYFYILGVSHLKIGFEQICLDSLGFLSILYNAEITWSFEKLTEAGIWNKCVTCEYI